MPDLPKKKVGIVACSGEELPEGTVTRLAALKVLEELRPADTQFVCPSSWPGGKGIGPLPVFIPPSLWMVVKNAARNEQRKCIPEVQQPVLW